MRDKTMSAGRKIFALTIAIILIFGMSFQSVVSFADDTQGSSLSLDNVTITDFKIIDTAAGNKVIDYSKSSDSPYIEDPAAFTNVICQNQSLSQIKMKLSMEYSNPGNPIKAGDILTIPADYGGTLLNFGELNLLDSDNKVLGKWEYKDGNFVLKFGGDHITNNDVDSFTASLETGDMVNYETIQMKTTTLGEKYVKYGRLGKDDLCVPFEKFYVNAVNLGKTEISLHKYPSETSNNTVTWALKFYSDVWYGPEGNFFAPYILENDGNYTPNTHSGIYIEDTLEGCVEKPYFGKLLSWEGGIDNDGKLFSGVYAIRFQEDILTEVDQGSRSRDEVKAALSEGEYCMYHNPNGSYTFMLRWWDMNDSNGFTYNDIDKVRDAGGVGNFLKQKYPDIYGDTDIVSDATIEKINQIYYGKAVQNVSISLIATYPTVSVDTYITNTMEITTDKTGKVEEPATAKLTPSGGEATLPLEAKLTKVDSVSGTALSEGFKFELQTSTDNGQSWSKVDLDESMVSVGTLNADKTVTPSEGIVKVNSLTDGTLYRFVEAENSEYYSEVAIDESKTNNKDNPTVANSVTFVASQNEGNDVVMYNERLEVLYTHEYYTEDPNGDKEWNGKKYSIVTGDTNTVNVPAGSEALILDKYYAGLVTSDVTYQDSKNEESVNVLLVAADGSLVVRHYYDKEEVIDPTDPTDPTDPVKDVFMKGSTTSIDGKEVKAGDELTYSITYKNTTGDDVSVMIKDTLPAHTTLVSVDHANADSGGVGKSSDGNTLIDWEKSVADGETFTVGFTVKVDDDVDADEIMNTATIKVGDEEYKTNTVKNTTPKATEKEVVNTGDSNNTAMYTMLFALSLGVLSLISMKRRYENE